METGAYMPSWSPDGNKLAFIAREEKKETKAPYQPEIYEENLRYNRAYVVDLTKDNKPEQVPLEGHFYSISFSPDGKKLASAIAPTPLVDHRYMNQKIHVYNSDDFSEITIVDHAAKLDGFTWNPNSKQLAFIGGADINDPTAGRILIADAKTGKVENLLPGFISIF